MANMKPIKVRNARKYMLDGTVDFDTDTFKVALLSSAYKPVKTRANSTAYLVGDWYLNAANNGHFYRCNVAGQSASSEPTVKTDGTAFVDGTATFQDMGTSFTPVIPARVNSTAYIVGQLYQPAVANGHFYICTIAGTSASSAPAFSVVGTTFVDGTVTFQDLGVRFPEVLVSDLIYGDVSANEITGTGYTAGGQTLANVTISRNGDAQMVDANDVVWTASTITARYAALYKNGTANSVENPLLVVFELDEAHVDVGSSSSDFTIQWNSNGILTLA